MIIKADEAKEGTSMVEDGNARLKELVLKYAEVEADRDDAVEAIRKAEREVQELEQDRGKIYAEISKACTFQGKKLFEHSAGKAVLVTRTETHTEIGVTIEVMEVW